jgi:hypothetical protein
MPLSLQNLDDTTRRFMVEELEYDLQQQKLYLSPRLSQAGRNQYPTLLTEALRSGTDSTLSIALRQPGMINPTEERRKPTGGVSIAKVPETAPETLAEGEFNRFYIRGLCRRAIESNLSDLQIYRAKQVANPRLESEAKIGSKISAKQLLQDLRTNVGLEPALGLPPGPNSGLSVRLA